MKKILIFLLFLTVTAFADVPNGLNEPVDNLIEILFWWIIKLITFALIFCAILFAMNKKEQAIGYLWNTFYGGGLSLIAVGASAWFGQ